jgi:hypothetical protein
MCRAPMAVSIGIRASDLKADFVSKGLNEYENAYDWIGDWYTA